MKQKHTLISLASLLGIFSLAVFLAAISSDKPAFAAASAGDGALIAVQFGPGEQIVREIDFTAPITGLAALQMSGLDVMTHDSGWGIAVCSINGVGCPADNCFCDSKFWNYEYWDGNAWQGYLVGASESTINDGAIEGWRWADWGVGSLPDAPQLLAAQKALDWLATQQSPTDGGYGSTSSSVESLLAIGADGIKADEWRFTPGSPSLMGYLLGRAGTFSQNNASSAGKLSIGLSAAGSCRPYGTKIPGDYYDSSSGQYEEGAGPQAWAMLGTSAISQSIPPAATAYLLGLQQPDGGWEWTPGGFGGGTDTNSTALAIQALIMAGESPTATSIISGVNYLQTAQNVDGGFPYDPDSPWGTDSDANSTAYVIQALYAVGVDPATWTISSTSPISYLLGLQLSDGSLEWQPGTGANLLSTQQAIPALLGRFDPFDRNLLENCPVSLLPLVKNGSAPE